jgi:7-keto-8-aminopelargonate synthetase-like enzyme
MVLGPELQFVDRDYVRFQGRRLLYLAGVDYHRMSNHPLLIKAVTEAAEQYGISTTGSRTTTGNHTLLVALEAAAAAFFATERAVVCPSGYLSNTLILQAIESEYDAFFIDEMAHTSLADASPCREKPRHSFKHLDADGLAGQLERHLSAKSRPLVLTDGVFPATGETAPLKDYAEVVEPYGGKILVDDAHAMAVLGESGKGTWEQQGVSRDCLYQAGTFSKGFGVGGGLIPADRELAEKIQNHSDAFIGCSGLALPLAAAALQSVSYLAAHREWMTGLQRRSLVLKRRFKGIGFAMPQTPVPIFSITCHDTERNRRLERHLIEHGIYAPFLHYPGSPPGGHFRFILTSSTTEEQESLLFETIRSSV